MEAFRSAGRHEDCLACWRELVVLDGLGDVNVSERTYNLALRSAVRAECWEEMEGIFDMMQVGLFFFLVVFDHILYLMHRSTP